MPGLDVCGCVCTCACEIEYMRLQRAVTNARACTHVHTHTHTHTHTSQALREGTWTRNSSVTRPSAKETLPLPLTSSHRLAASPITLVRSLHSAFLHQHIAYKPNSYPLNKTIQTRLPTPLTSKTPQRMSVTVKPKHVRLLL